MNRNQKVVCFGEVMMRLSPPSYERFVQAKQFDVDFGGSEANVALSLANFGVHAEHVTRFPENDFGKAATAHLRSQGVATANIVYGEDRMGVYFIEQGADHRSPKVIYDRYHSAFARITPSMFDWNEILRGASWFHWSGITPAISQGAAEVCQDAIRTAKKLGITTSGDINYRRNLWNYGAKARDSMPGLIAESNFLLGSLTDFENCMGIQSSDFQEACIKIKKQFPSVLKIATTQRDVVQSAHQRISAFLWSDDLLVKSKVYEMTQIIDRVGSGDAFMAGLIYGSICSMNDQEMIEFAIAAAVLKHSISGDVNRVSVEEVNALRRGENVGKLLR